MCFKALQLKVWTAFHSVLGSKLFTLLTCPGRCHLVRCRYDLSRICNASSTEPWQCMCHMRLLGPQSSYAIISASINQGARWLRI